MDSSIESDCTIIDEEMAKMAVLPGNEGSYYATAGRLAWHRDLKETEFDFVSRAREEAAAAGYRTVRVIGFVALVANSRRLP